MSKSSVKTGKINPEIVIGALLYLRRENNIIGTINIKQFYYACSMIAQFDLPDVFKDWYFCRFVDGILSEEVDGYLQYALACDLITRVDKPCGQSYFQIDSDFLSAYRGAISYDSDLVAGLFRKFEEYMIEAISTNHLKS